MWSIVTNKLKVKNKAINCIKNTSAQNSQSKNWQNPKQKHTVKAKIKINTILNSKYENYRQHTEKAKARKLNFFKYENPFHEYKTFFSSSGTTEVSLHQENAIQQSLNRLHICIAFNGLRNEKGGCCKKMEEILQENGEELALYYHWKNSGSHPDRFSMR